MKKLIIFFLLFFSFNIVKAEELTSYSESAILIELSTGKVLYEKDADLEKAPASMTKIMSLILIMDSLKNNNIKLNEDVIISENASGMGGSQVYLNTGEKYKVEELLKSVAIASANDAVVALSEKVAGTEENFVKLMNKKCQELGCTHTNFVNPHGLDTDNHYSSARDMALMAKYLINNYSEILNYTNIYEDYLNRPDGSNTWLVNTNKLVRFYDIIDGLKTGFTSNAGYCLTATAQKGDMRLISVVMGVDSSDHRTNDTLKLINYGFNNYKLETIYKKGKVLDKVRINNAKNNIVDIVLMEDATELLNINDLNKKYTINIKLNKLKAPIKIGDIVGKAEIIDNESNIIKNINITVKDNVYKANIIDYFKRNFNTLINGKNIINKTRYI